MPDEEQAQPIEPWIVAPPALTSLEDADLEAMRDAAEAIIECQRVVGKTNHNIISELLRDKGTFYQWNHYPAGDVRDNETGSQYYYHAHRIDEANHEHGHFHTFVRSTPQTDDRPPTSASPDGQSAPAITHLVAVSMDSLGRPQALFTTNRWVTGESWRPAEQAIEMLHRFEIDQAWPSWPVNLWLTSLLRLFRPTIEVLLRERDRRIAEFADSSDTDAVFENRRLEVTGLAAISVERQVTEVIAALGDR